MSVPSMRAVRVQRFGGPEVLQVFDFFFFQYHMCLMFVMIVCYFSGGSQCACARGGGGAGDGEGGGGWHQPCGNLHQRGWDDFLGVTSHSSFFRSIQQAARVALHTWHRCCWLCPSDWKESQQSQGEAAEKMF